MYVFFLDILRHPLTPLLVMMRQWCDRLGARRSRERWECCVAVKWVASVWGGKTYRGRWGKWCAGEKPNSSDKLILTPGPLTLWVCVRALLAALFFCFVYTSYPIGDIAITGKCTDSILGPWWVQVQVCVCVCRHARVMFKHVCVCKSIWGVIAGSLLVWENHTSCSLPTPCRGQDPLTAPHCYFFMFVKCGVSMHMHARMHARTHTHTHTHRCYQQFPSFQTPLTPKWDRVCQLGADNPPAIRTLCFTVPSQNHRVSF